MRRFLASLILPLLLAACGGGGAPSVPLPEAQASAVTSGCPAGDATVQLQAMVDTAKGELKLPPCVFNVSQTIVIRKPLDFVGSGANVNGTIIRSSAKVGILLEPDVTVSVGSCGPSCRGWWAYFSAFRIEPVAVGQGGLDGHAMVWRIGKGRFISSSDIHRVYLGDFGGQGLLLDNEAANVDGFFTTTVSRSWIENGVRGVLIGDSMTFAGNVIPDGKSRPGQPGLPGFDISTVPGAAESVFRENNVTTSGGCFLVRDGTGLGILNNWCESAGAGAALALIQLNNCAECTVRDNRVQTLSGSAPFALAFDGGELNALDSNKLNLGKAGHVAFVNTKQNKLVGLNRFIGPGDVLAGQMTGAAAGLLTAP